MYVLFTKADDVKTYLKGYTPFETTIDIDEALQVTTDQLRIVLNWLNDNAYPVNNFHVGSVPHPH